MSVPETAINMQTMASKDLAALRGMIDASLFADEIFGFHAQQAVEKSLKAWITVAGDTFGFYNTPSDFLKFIMTSERSIQQCL